MSPSMSSSDCTQYPQYPLRLRRPTHLQCRNIYHSSLTRPHLSTTPSEKPDRDIPPLEYHPLQTTPKLRRPCNHQEPRDRSRSPTPELERPSSSLWKPLTHLHPPGRNRRRTGTPTKWSAHLFRILFRVPLGPDPFVRVQGGCLLPLKPQKAREENRRSRLPIRAKNRRHILRIKIQPSLRRATKHIPPDPNHPGIAERVATRVSRESRVRYKAASDEKD